jgi:hypothetical protein
MSEQISSVKLQIKMTGSLTNTLTDGSAATVSCPNANYSDSITNGLGSGSADRSWQKVNGSIAEHGEQIVFDLEDMEGIDIGAGAGLDALGQAVDWENIVALIVVNENAAGAAGLLEVLPADDEGWTPVGSHTQAVGGALKPQGILCKYQPEEGGLDISATSHRLTLRAYGGAVTFSIYILARTGDLETSSSSVSSSSSSTSSTSSQSVSSSSSSISTSSSSGSMSSSSLTSSVSSASSVSSQSVSSSSSSTSSVSSVSSVSSSSSSQSSSSLS